MNASKKRISIIILLLLLVIAAIAYFFVVPVLITQEYTDKVHDTARPLNTTFSEISRSTELLLSTDADTPEAKRSDDTAHIRKVVDDGKKKIADLHEVTDTFIFPPYSNIAGQYVGVEILRGHANRLINQSEDALNSYLALIAYIETYNKVSTEVAAELRSFNAVSDINIFAGRWDTIEATAQKLRAQASLLSRSSPPHELEAVHSATIAAINDAAEGFDDLAYGLLIPADDPIYAAARKIEAASGAIDTTENQLYDSLQNSRVIKDIEDLDEKLELV